MPHAGLYSPEVRVATADLSLVLDRIAYEPEHTELAEIPWPEGLAPTPTETLLQYDGSLPQCDVFVGTWTAAEAKALADVLTPGVETTSWLHYAKNWDEFLPQLTGRSPAKEAGRLGECYLTKIGPWKVLCFHSQLHPATDGPTLPTAALWAQLAKETGAKLMISTGTAGGAGMQVELGDINIASAIRADFDTRLKGHPWSQEEWATSPLSDGQKAKLSADVLGPLFAANSGHLPAKYATRPPKVWNGHIVSTDQFAYWTEDGEPFHLSTVDPQISVVDMDEAGVAVGVLGMNNPPMLMSCRNASDPPLPAGNAAELKLAEKIYQTFGYYTTINSAIGCWALIAGLEQD